MKEGIGRRAWLFGAGAGVAAARPGARPAKPAARPTAIDPLKEALRYRKIDSHCHLLGSGARKLIEAADRVGIERLAISIPRGDTPEQFRESNDRILAAMREFPKRFVGQCFVNPQHPKEAMAEMMRCLDAGMVGLGELYSQVKICDPLYYPLIEKSIELKAPVMMHARADVGLLRGRKASTPPTTSVAGDFAAAARRYPEAMIIHSHIGGGGDWEYMCKTLRDVPSVYIDTSGSVSDEGMIDFALRTLGVNRMLFATDLNFETGVGKILAADLTEAQRRAIFWDNYNNILRKRGNHAS